MKSKLPNDELMEGKRESSDAMESLAATCRAAVKRVSTLAEAAFSTIVYMEKLKEISRERGNVKAWDDAIDKFDETLALMARGLTTYISIRGEKTTNRDLLCHIYAETLGGLERFPAIWKRVTAEEEDSLSPDSPGHWLLSGLTTAVQLFQSECEKRPKLFQFWAQEQPCLPMLVFKHRAAYRKRFNRLAEATSLGIHCPINVSPRANYSLENPINAKVFEILMDFGHARDWITFVCGPKKEGLAKSTEDVESQLAKRAGLSREMQPIYFAAMNLPPLSKNTAPQWADIYVMPYLELSPDFLSSPEFATIRQRKRVKSPATMRVEVRKDVIRSLVGLARPVAPKHRKSSAKR